MEIPATAIFTIGAEKRELSLPLMIRFAMNKSAFRMDWFLFLQK